MKLSLIILVCLFLSCSMDTDQKYVKNEVDLLKPQDLCTLDFKSLKQEYIQGKVPIKLEIQNIYRRDIGISPWFNSVNFRIFKST